MLVNKKIRPIPFKISIIKDKKQTMYNKNAKKVIKKLNALTPAYKRFCDVIERKNKKKSDFELALKLGNTLFSKAYVLLPKVKHFMKKTNHSTLKEGELNQLILVFKQYKKLEHVAQDVFKNNPVFFRKIYDKKQSKISIQCNTLFILSIDYVTRNFMGITLPDNFNVDQFHNDGSKTSLLTMLNSTNWSKYFDNDEYCNEMMNFSNLVLTTLWWNHAKFYRNVLVHRIPLDTYNIPNKDRPNMRIRCYLPVICFLCLKYFMYNLMSSLEEVPTKATLFSKLYKKDKPTKVSAQDQEVVDSTSKEQEQDSILNPNEESLDVDVNEEAKPASDETSNKPDDQPASEEIKDQNPTDDNKQMDFDRSSHHYSVDNPSSI